MDWAKIIETVLMLIISFVIPVVSVRIAGYIKANGDKAKQEKRLLVMQEIDRMAESALNMIRSSNPGASILPKIDAVKDQLAAKILADVTIPVNKGEIAARVAGDAVFKVALEEFVKPRV